MPEPVVVALFIAPEGGAPMRRVAEVHAIRGEGLEHDRYRVDRGYWSRSGWDVCQVTLIRGEDLEEIERAAGLRVVGGEHRRNVVTRGLDLHGLAGTRFRIGDAELEYDRPRPPCRHLETLTQDGMLVALRGGRGGIGARIVRSGVMKVGDGIVVG